MLERLWIKNIAVWPLNMNCENQFVRLFPRHNRAILNYPDVGGVSHYNIWVKCEHTHTHVRACGFSPLASPDTFGQSWLAPPKPSQRYIRAEHRLRSEPSQVFSTQSQLLIKSLILFIDCNNNRNQTPGNVCQARSWRGLMRRLHMWMMKYAWVIPSFLFQIWDH